MSDGYPELEPLDIEKWRDVPPAERLRIGSEMFATYKEQLFVQIRQEIGHDEPKKERRLLFLRLYGDDFTPEEADRILSHLDKKVPV